MAARLWRSLLLGELGCAVGLGALLRAACGLSLPATGLAALAAWVALPCILLGLSFIAARVAQDPQRPRVSGLELLRALVSETLAFERAALAMSIEPWRRSFCAGSSRVPSPGGPVLLVHGIACNQGVWRPMAQALSRHGFGPIRAVNLEPLFADIDAYAAQVANELRRLRQECDGARVAVVAHSMGGLVARAALRLAGPDDIRQIVTLASPHHGTSLAYLLWQLPYQQMRPESQWLAALNTAQEGHFRVPVTSIYSVNDNLVTPARSAALEGARLFELAGLGHLSQLSARESIDCTLAALSGPRAAPQPCLMPR